jgi:hypothetical protein
MVNYPWSIYSPALRDFKRALGRTSPAPRAQTKTWPTMAIHVKRPDSQEEFVKLLAPAQDGGFSAWKSPNFPKTEDTAKALYEHVLALESRHGAAIWSPIERLGG